MHMLITKPMLLILRGYKYMFFLCMSICGGPEYACTIHIST